MNYIDPTWSDRMYTPIRMRYDELIQKEWRHKYKKSGEPGPPLTKEEFDLKVRLNKAKNYLIMRVVRGPRKSGGAYWKYDQESDVWYLRTDNVILATVSGLVAWEVQSGKMSQVKLKRTIFVPDAPDLPMPGPDNPEKMRQALTESIADAAK